MQNFLKHFIIIAFSCFWSIFAYARSNSDIDISVSDISKRNIHLFDNWEFYEFQLYDPKDFETEIPLKPEIVKLPHLWNQKESGKISSGKGYATYRISISGLEKSKTYCLNINRIQTAYKIFIDGNLKHEVGKVSTDKKNGKPGWSSDDIYFTPKYDKTEIIIQVSNFFHRKGGIENEIVLGTAENMHSKANKLFALTVFLIGILLIMAAYHLGMFFFKRNDSSNLWFALAMISTGIFSLTVSEILLEKIFPAINWQILVKTNYIFNYLRLLFFVLFIYHTFKKHLSTIFVRIIIYAVLINILFILIVPAAIFTHTLIIFLVFTAVSLFFMIYGQIKGVIQKQPGALISFFGILALLIAVGNDFLKEIQLINTISLTTFGLFIFIVFNSYLISITNAHSYKSIKKITQNLLLQGKIKNALFDSDSYNLNAPLKAVADAVNCDRALIFIFRDNNWIATNEYLKEESRIKELNIPVFAGKENVYFSSGIVKKAVSTREPTYILVNDAEKAKYHEYLEGSTIASVYAYPIIKDNLVQSLLYFENWSLKLNFEEFATDMLKSLIPHISVFMDNLAAYNQLNFKNIELEEKIKLVSAQIENRSSELRKMRDEIEKQNSSIEETSTKLQTQNQAINDGIRYAKKIQTAFLNSGKNLKDIFHDNFVYSKNAGVLSGNFYKFKILNDNDCLLIMADAGGQDISGALMSFIGYEIFDTIIEEHKTVSPKLILNEMQEIVLSRLKDESANILFNVSAVYINLNKREMIFSGAAHSIFYAFNNDMIEYRSIDDPIGYENAYQNKETKRFFSNRRISIEKKGTIYIFTNGAVKAMNNNQNSSTGQPSFKDLIKTIRNEDLGSQYKILDLEFSKRLNNNVNDDDILVIALNV